MLLELSKTLLSLILIVPAAYFSGYCLRPLIHEKDVVLRGIVYFALGLALLSCGMIVLSLFHLLRPFPILIFLLAWFLLCRNRVGDLSDWFGEIVDMFQFSGASAFFKLLSLSFFISFLALLLGTFSPEIGGDALAYQLNLAKEFLRKGSLVPDPFDYNSFFPLLMNNLYLIGLAAAGVFSAKFFHFFCGLLLFFSLWRVLLKEIGHRSTALFIALVFWVTPAVFNLLSTCYVDVALAFYSFLSVVFFSAALRDGKPGTFFLSGLLMGCAVSVKYLAMISAVGIVAAALTTATLEKKTSILLKGILIWGLGILVVSGGWLIRNWFATGNPFFPYLGSLFHLEHRPPTNFHIYGVGGALHHFILIFWNMFRQPAEFGSSTTRIGIFYFLALPFVLRSLIKEPRSRFYGVFALVFLVIWFFVAQADRWIIPVLPVLGLLAGFGIKDFLAGTDKRWKKIMRFSVSTATLGILAVYVLAGVYHYRYSYLLYLGRWTPQTYLRKMERTAPIAEWVNRSLPLKSKILIESEPRKFYFNRDLLYDVFLQWRTRYQEKYAMPEEIHRYFQSLGVTHLLTSEPVSESSDGKKEAPVRKLAKSNYATELYTVRSENIRDAQHVYRLFEI